MVASRYFYNNEADEVVTDVDLFKIWQGDKTLEEEYEHFQDYVEACQWYNNGSLEEITTRTFDDYVERYENEGKRYRVYYLEEDARWDYRDASIALVANVIEDMTDSWDDDEYDAIYVYIPHD